MFLCLLAFPAAASAATEQVQDGSFEAGFSGWVFDDGSERCEAENDICGPFPAASGNFYAASQTSTSLGPMTGEAQVGTITQLVPVPGLPATLSFALREITNIGPIGDLELLLKVKYDGQVLEEISAAEESFEPVTIPIPGALGGADPRPLTFEVTCFNNTISTGSCARFDIDDVSLLAETGSSTAPPATGGGSGQASPPPPAPDVIPPETTLRRIKSLAFVETPKARAKVKARFSSEPGTRFECKLDRRAYAPCTSPKTLKLKVGKHVFRVRASDAAGNVDETPARAVIRVKLKALL
ncbi:MAG TPA: hypothetical protein VFJ53_02755 [Solirubrobacterales bacterium]|nr:hypothetical protein [Solirubrobacterales bacterium]